MPYGYERVTPMMLRTGYHLRPRPTFPPMDPAERLAALGEGFGPEPAAGAGPGDDGFADWLGHVAAGRIPVR